MKDVGATNINKGIAKGSIVFKVIQKANLNDNMESLIEKEIEHLHTIDIIRSMFDEYNEVGKLVGYSIKAEEEKFYLNIN